MMLEFLSFFITTFAIGYSIFSNDHNGPLIGLLMNYTLNLSYEVIDTTLAEAQFQTKLVSLQRILTFLKIQPQDSYVDYCVNKQWHTKQEGWKDVVQEGKIQFKDLSSRYRNDLPDVLKKVNITISKGQKVGIVGRTGAGKSSIMNVLLRITEISNGNLEIDGKDIREYFVKDLRNSITMIDQQPTLIKSTFRQNLDITHKYTDQQLINILKDCNLYDIVMQKDGLGGKVSNDSLSAGEKQLICICRAILKNSKIVLIDQATANIDTKNDQMIQKVIQEKFVNSTVLTIAHRLSTLKNCDKILVLGEGKMLEWGTPKDLENKQGGIYAEMITKNLSEFLS